MQRPTLLLKNTTLTWVMRIYNSSDALVDADSTPTVAVRKNGSSTGDSVTVTKRSATTGIYDCSYNPASEVEGDQFTIEETAVVSGTTTSWNWSFMVLDSDVTGKVLGGGSGTISGVGARAVDYDGQNIAPAATALSSATWTNSLASALTTAATSVATLLTRIVGTLASGTHNPQSGDAYPSAVSAASSASSASSSASTAATQATLAVKLAKAQAVTDTGQTPWQEVLIEQGTGGLGVGTELRRVALKQTDGTGVTSTNHVVGQKVDVS